MRASRTTGPRTLGRRSSGPGVAAESAGSESVLGVGEPSQASICTQASSGELAFSFHVRGLVTTPKNSWMQGRGMARRSAPSALSRSTSRADEEGTEPRLPGVAARSCAIALAVAESSELDPAGAERQRRGDARRAAGERRMRGPDRPQRGLEPRGRGVRDPQPLETQSDVGHARGGVHARGPLDERRAVQATALKASGTPIGNNDLWIACHALAENATLVTNNVREFERVDGLSLDNWAS